MNKETMALTYPQLLKRILVILYHNFSMPSILLILHGEAKSYCFTASCVPESISLHLKWIHSEFLCFDMLRIKQNSKTLTCKQKQRCS